MNDFRLRPDLTRAVIDGFALPLGIEPDGLHAPNQGYTVTYTPGEEDEPDTYAFHVVVSHEKLSRLLDLAFGFLPDEVYAIVEIGSRDAYRQIDVFLGSDPIGIEDFLASWRHYEPILLEDASIAAGANSEEPFVEVFVDQWKGVAIHVPLSMRDDVEDMLRSLDLDEVAQTWAPETEEQRDYAASRVRPVLDSSDEYLPDIDELLLNLRHEWKLELNIDPETNVDDSGRPLGLTLWHAMVIVESTEKPDTGAYMSVWATAGSLTQMEQIISAAASSQHGWQFSEIYMVDRVAYDERPDELADLPPRRNEPEIHLIEVEPWNDEPPSGEQLAPRERFE